MHYLFRDEKGDHIATFSDWQFPFSIHIRSRLILPRRTLVFWIFAVEEMHKIETLILLTVSKEINPHVCN